MIEEIKKRKFGDKVYIGFTNGVIVKVTHKRKWTYYDIVFENAEIRENAWSERLFECETYREDKI